MLRVDAAELQEDAGAVVEERDGDDLVLSWLENSRDAEPVQVIRYEPESRLLRIFPKVTAGGVGLDAQFDQIAEIQLEAGVTEWDPERHTGEGSNGHLQAIGLPRGFETTYDFGIGIEGGFQGLILEIEEHTTCTVVRIVAGQDEGEEGGVFRISATRFARWVTEVRTNRDRGRKAVNRVNVAYRHNLLTDLLNTDPVEPEFNRSALINAITEVVATGHLLDREDRGTLVAQMAKVAPVVAREDPEQFGRLRQEVELASLDALIQRFALGLQTAANNKDEGYWQGFFRTNPFALQQLFSAPIDLYREHLHVRGSNGEGRGQRITDFAYINPITLSAFIIEIKTPGTKLTAKKEYRGASGSEAYAPHADLSGAVAQVQSQMASMREDFPDLKRRTPSLPDIDPHDVHGAVIVGRVGDLAGVDAGQRLASFKRYRSALTGVTVIGFDEVLERLRALHRMLAGPSGALGEDDADEPDAEAETTPPAAVSEAARDGGPVARPVARRLRPAARAVDED